MKISHILLLSVISFSLSSCSQESREKHVHKFMEESGKQEKDTHDAVVAYNILSGTLQDRKVYSGPLGLKMGLDKDELKKSVGKITSVKQTSQYEVIKVDGLEGHSNQKMEYLLTISKSSGLCLILGQGNFKYNDDESSTVLRDIFIDLETSISDKYNTSNIERGWAVDWMERPDIWQYAGGRASELLYKEWSGFENSDNLRKIVLLIDHNRPDNNKIHKNYGQIKLRYEFDNYNDDCK